MLTLATFLILNMDQYDVMSVTKVFLFHFFLNEDKVLLEDIPQTVGSWVFFFFKSYKQILYSREGNTLGEESGAPSQVLTPRGHGKPGVGPRLRL